MATDDAAQEVEAFDESKYENERKATARLAREEQEAVEQRQFEDGLRALRAITDEDWEEAVAQTEESL